MSDASDRVCEKLKTLEAEREASGSPRVVSGELLLYRKTAHYLGDAEAPARIGADLKDEWEVACFYSGGRDTPADVREALEQKIKEARDAGATTPAQKDPWGQKHVRCRYYADLERYMRRQKKLAEMDDGAVARGYLLDHGERKAKGEAVPPLPARSSLP
jgi:hypothetical protein